MENFVETSCLFCQEAEDRVMFEARLRAESFTGYAFSARRKVGREHYRVVKCLKCSLVRSNPIAEENRLNRLYERSCFLYSDEVIYAAETYAQLVDRLAKKYNITLNSLMEIGCGTGFFLEKMLERGITDIAGFEPSTDCLEKAADAVRPHLVGDVYRPELLGTKQYDAACAFHVMDHLPHPDQTLSSVVDHLAPGGHVFVVCHDVESWTAKVLGDFSPIFDVEHIYLFSQKTIRMLFERAGLEVLEVGSLSNRYPIGYWVRIIPFANKFLPLLPEFIKKRPIDVRAGNLYALGRKMG